MQKTTVAPPLSVAEQGRIFNFVKQINMEQLDGQMVRERLRQLQLALPHASLEIVSETENIGGDVTYCLLMTHGESVYSLSCSRQNVLPWQLRGATNAEANELLTVNGYKVTVENAVHLLDFIWEKEDLAARMIEMALLAQEAEKRPANLSERELADALLRFYSDRSLQTIQAQAGWLDNKGLTEPNLTRLLEAVLLRRKCERSLVEEQYKLELRDHTQDYLGVRVMQTTIPDYCLGEAERLIQIHAQGKNLSFIVNELARSISFRHPFRIDYAELFRHDLDSHADDVFAKAEGNLLVISMPSGEVRLIEIVAIESKISKATLERRIMHKLMNQWYLKQRRSARIEWHWGKSG